MNARERVTARRGLVFAASVLLAAVFSTAPADAAIRTWNSQRGTWATTGNWLGGTVPTSSDSVYFSGATVGSGTAVSVIATNYTVLGLTFAGSGSTSVTGSASSNQLWIDSEGVTVQAGAGAATISGLQGYLNASGTWRNDSTNTFRVASSLNTSAGNVILTVDGSGNSIYSGIISGGAGRTIGVVKQGTGSLTLSGVNTYANGFTLSSGTLVIGNAAAFSTGTITIGGGVIDSTASFTASAANTQAWNGSFSFLGTSGSLTFGTGAGAAITLGTTPTITVANNTLVVNGTIGDGGNTRGLTKAGAGALVLGGSNSFTGTTTLTGGTLGLNSNGALGTSRLEITGGVLDVNAARTLPVTSQAWNGNFTFLGTNTLDTGTAAVTLGASPTVTVAASSFTIGGAIGETGGARRLEKSGGGLLVLNGTNSSYTGGTLLSGGTIQVGGTAALGTSGSITFGGGVLRYTTMGAATDYSSRIKGSTAAVSIDTGAVASVTFASGLESTNAGGLAKSGTGTLVLTASNSFAGDTTISAGSLQIGSGGSSGWLPSSNVANAGTLIFNRSDAYGGSFNALIAGTGGVTLSGGTLTLAAANTYSGTTAVNAGVLLVGNTSALQNSVVNVASGANMSFKSGLGPGPAFASGIAGGGTITLQDDGGSPAAVTLSLTSGSFTGRLVGSGGFTKTGAGVLHLNGSNGYAGTTTIQNGAVSMLLGGGTVLGTGPLVITGGTLTTGTAALGTVFPLVNSSYAWNGDFTFNMAASSNSYISVTTGTVTLGGAGTTRLVTGGVSRDLRISTVVTGSVGIDKRGLGSLVLNGNNTYSGNTTVTSGQVVLNGNNTTTGTTILQSSGTLTLGNAGALGSGPLVINGGFVWNNGTVAITTANPMFWNADFTVAMQGAGVDLNLGTGPVTLGGNIAATFIGQSNSVNGSIGDGGNAYRFTRLGTSALTLGGSNSYSGGTTLGGSGYTIANNSYALGTAGEISFAGGSLRYSAANPLIDISSRITNSSSAIQLDAANATVTLASQIDSSNVGGLILGAGGSPTGGGIYVISGSNTYSGTTAVIPTGNPVVYVNNDFAFSTGTVALGSTASSVTLENSSGATRTLANVFRLQGTTGYIAFNTSGTSSPIAFSGTTIAAGALLRVDSGTLTFATLDADGTSRGLVKAGAGTLAVTGPAGPTLQGTITGSAGTLLIGDAAALGSGTIILQNSGALAASKSLTGTDAVANPWRLGGPGTIGGANSLEMRGTLTAAASNTLTNSLPSGRTLTMSGGANLAGGVTLTLAGTGATVVSGTIYDDGVTPGGLTIAGGTTTLLAANTYTGTTTLSGGVLAIGGSSALGPGLILFNGGTLGPTADMQLVNTIQINNAGNNNTAFRGAGNLTLSGSFLPLTANRSVVNNLDAGKTLTIASDVSMVTGSTGYTLSIYGGGNVLVRGQLVGGGTGGSALSWLGTGTLTLSGSNSYTGATTVSNTSGPLNINSAYALTSGTLSLSGAATLGNTSGAAVTVATATPILYSSGAATLNFIGPDSLNFGTNTFTSGQDYTLNTVTGTLTLGGLRILSGQTSGRLGVKTGTGTLVLTDTSSFTGSFTVMAGTLRLQGNGDTGAGGVIVNSGAYDLNGLNRTLAALTLGGSAAGTTSALVTGSGTATLGGNVTYTGTAANDNGALISGNLDLGSATRTFAVADSSAASTDLAIPANISGVGGLSKTLAGSLVLSGSNTYAGTTTVSAGLLLLNSAGALSAASPLTIGGGILGLGTGNTSFTRAQGSAAGQVQLNSGGFAAYGQDAVVNLGGVSGTVNAVGTMILGAASADKTIDFQNVLNLGSGGSKTVQVDHGSADIDAILSGGIVGTTGSTGFIKTGQGTLLITAAGSYTGTTSIRQGVLQIASLANAGSNSPLGVNATIEIGAASTSGTLRYTGSGHATNRVLSLSGGNAVEAAGSGSIQFGGASTSTAAAQTLLLAGTSTAANAISGNIADGSGMTSVTKTGAGSWTLAGNNTFTGQASVVQGTLVVGHASALGSGPRPLVGGTDAGLGGTAALLLSSGISFNRDLEVTASGSGGAQVVTLGGANTSGTTVFGPAMLRVARDVTLQAATGGAVRFGSNWTGASGSGTLTDRSFTFGSTGNAGTVIVSSSIATTGGGMTVAAGTLRIADQIVRPAPGMPFTISAAGELAGTGTVAAVLAGAGSVGPGNSPGILLADGVDPSGGLDFDFEFTDLEPLYSSPTLSRNDILRLTGTAPFTASLSPANSVDVYFPASIAAGQTYFGGFFSDQTTALFSDFSSRISNASFTYYVADAGGTVSYKGNSYSLLPNAILVTPTTTTVATANFSGGTVTNGQITTFVVVPEPETAIFAGIGIAMLGWTLWKRRRLAAITRGRGAVARSGGPALAEHGHERP